MPLFPNIRPKKAALALIDAERHPVLHKYAVVSAGTTMGVSERREQLWIEGYRRYGDEMEAALQRSSKNIKNARVWHRNLEAKLEDPWMLVGLTTGTMDPTLLFAWKTFRYGDDEQSNQAEVVVRLYVNNGNPPPRFPQFCDWYRPLAPYGIKLDDNSWMGFANRDFKSWTPDDLFRVMDTGIGAEEAKRTGLKRAEQVLLYTDGMPIEYAQEM